MAFRINHSSMNILSTSSSVWTKDQRTTTFPFPERSLILLLLFFLFILFLSKLIILSNNFVNRNIYIFVIETIFNWNHYTFPIYKNNSIPRDNRSVIILSKYRMIKITFNSESFNKRLIRLTLNHISFIDVIVCPAIWIDGSTSYI